jgi:hypothetical protein
LDWGGEFPGSHANYRTRNAPNEDIFIFKPKPQHLGHNNKRKAEEILSTPQNKLRRDQAHVRDGNDNVAQPR